MRWTRGLDRHSRVVCDVRLFFRAEDGPTFGRLRTNFVRAGPSAALRSAQDDGVDVDRVAHPFSCQLRRTAGPSTARFALGRDDKSERVLCSG